MQPGTVPFEEEEVVVGIVHEEGIPVGDAIVVGAVIGEGSAPLLVDGRAVRDVEVTCAGLDTARESAMTCATGDDVTTV